MNQPVSESPFQVLNLQCTIEIKKAQLEILLIEFLKIFGADIQCLVCISEGISVDFKYPLAVAYFAITALPGKVLTINFK